MGNWEQLTETERQTIAEEIGRISNSMLGRFQETPFDEAIVRIRSLALDVTINAEIVRRISGTQAEPMHLAKFRDSCLEAATLLQGLAFHAGAMEAMLYRFKRQHEGNSDAHL